MHDQQLAEKKALQKSFMDERERERQEIKVRSNRMANEEKLLTDLKRQQQVLYRESLDNQIKERDGYLRDYVKAPLRSSSQRADRREHNPDSSYYGAMMSAMRKEKAAQAMEISADPRKPDPIINPIARSDNPYINNITTGKNIFRGAAKSLLNQ